MADVVYAMGTAPGGNPQAAGQSPLMSILPLVFVFFIFYFLIIRPQQKKQKEHQQMISKLKKGDRVVTSGGLHAEVIGIKDKENIVVLKIADNVKIEFQRSAISYVKPS